MALNATGKKYSKEPGGQYAFHSGHDGYEKPIAAFVPSIAPSSVLHVKDFHPNWNDNILLGGLKRMLHRVYLEGDDVLFVEPIDLGFRIRDMAHTNNRRIAIFTDDNKLAFVEPETSWAEYERIQSFLNLEKDDSLRVATQEAFYACLECHGFEMNEQGAGPSLFRVCGRKPDTENFRDYSGALSQAVSVWNKDALVRFISNPKAVAPGTSMSWGGTENVKIAELLAHSICYLDNG